MDEIGEVGGVDGLFIVGVGEEEEEDRGDDRTEEEGGGEEVDCGLRMRMGSRAFWWGLGK